MPKVTTYKTNSFCFLKTEINNCECKQQQYKKQMPRKFYHKVKYTFDRILSKSMRSSVIIFRSRSSEVFLGKVLKIYSKFPGEHPCRSVIYWNHAKHLWRAASKSSFWKYCWHFRLEIFICSLTVSLLTLMGGK